MLHERLKRLTKPFHDELEFESLTTKIVNKIITEQEYINLLQNLYILLKPFEDELLNHHKQFLDYGLDVSERLRAELLKNNLDVLSATIPQYNTYKFKSIEDLIGKLYVFEGSTMGGMFLYKALDDIGFAKNARSYFLPYGDCTTQKWSEFTRFLNSLNKYNFDEDKIILSACKAFLDAR